MTRFGTKPLCLAVAALASAAAPAARAEAPARGSEISFRLQRYRPAIDSEFGGSGPYELAFGSGGAWGGRLEYARTLSGALGTVGLGAGLGYFSAYGHGLYQDAATGEWAESADSTALHVVPASIFAMARFDAFANRWRIPVAPYARVSLERYMWLTTATAHDSTSGATNGWAVTLGVALLLDGIDPALANELRRESGIRHTCLTFDATRAMVDDFGSAHSWDLSSEGWALSGGLSFTF